MPDASSPPITQTPAPTGAPPPPPEALLLPFQAYQRLVNYLATRPWIEVRGLMDELVRLEPGAPAGDASEPAKLG